MSFDLQLCSYDGVVFPYCTISYSGRVEYDESGLILQGITLVFRGSTLVSSSSAGVNGSGGGTGGVTDFDTNLYRVLDVLSHPRREFLWQNGGQTVFDIKSSGSDVEASRIKIDRRWGPKPKVLSVEKHTGGKAARVNFEIECFVFFCNGDSSIGDLEEFHWSYSYSFDKNFSCTRTVRGRYRLRSPLQTGSEFLATGAYWPSLPSSFYRESTNHSLSADGSILEFTITDKQRWRTLPRPMTDGHATMRITQRGAQLTKNYSGMFEAPIDTDKKVIMQLVSAMIAIRFVDAFLPTGSGGTFKEWITDLTLTNEEFDNRISFSVTSTRGATNATQVTGPTGNIDNAMAYIAQAFGDVASITPGSGDQWLASNGSSELRGMLGTAGLVPQGSPSLISAAAAQATPGRLRFPAMRRLMIPAAGAEAVENSPSARRHEARQHSPIRPSDRKRYFSMRRLADKPITLTRLLPKAGRSSSTTISK